jgi:RNA polymerase sigma-70 factor (ECF subfamily)
MDLLTAKAGTEINKTGWDERSCLQGCAKGELQSQEVFYRRFYPAMMALVKRYTDDKDECTSILNNAFLKAFRKIGSFRNEGSLEGWLRRIVIHAVSDYFRYRHQPQEIPHDTVPDNVSKNTSIEIPYDYQLLLKLFEGLPPSTRAVVNLFIIEGYGHKEIGSIMGISENTSKWHVAEGRKLLQQKLNILKK